MQQLEQDPEQEPQSWQAPTRESGTGEGTHCEAATATGNRMQQRQFLSLVNFHGGNEPPSHPYSLICCQVAVIGFGVGFWI